MGAGQSARCTWRLLNLGSSSTSNDEALGLVVTSIFKTHYLFTLLHSCEIVVYY